MPLTLELTRPISGCKSAMDKPAMGASDKMAKPDSMAKPAADKMEKPGSMMDKKDSMSSDKMKK